MIIPAQVSRPNRRIFWAPDLVHNKLSEFHYLESYLPLFSSMALLAPFLVPAWCQPLDLALYSAFLV